MSILQKLNLSFIYKRIVTLYFELKKIKIKKNTIKEEVKNYAFK